MEVTEQEIKLKGMVVSTMTTLISTTSTTAKKIMEVFRYFRIKKDGILSTKLILTKRELWQDITDKHFTQAIEELIEMGYIAKIKTKAGWRLLERGDEYLKQLERRGISL